MKNLNDVYEVQERLNEAEERLYTEIRKGTPYSELDDLFTEVEELQKQMEQFEEE